MTPLPRTVDELVRHQAFVRALARRLVPGSHDAEDVAQDTYAAALAADRDAVAAPRGWLTRIAGNAARQQRRGGTRRRQREHSALAQPTAPSAAEVAETLDTQRAVASAVAGLAEPYRTAVFLRFYQGLDSRRIAADLGVPLETVRTRVKRALAQLRERLDDEFGGRSRWATALAPLLEPAAAPGALGVFGGLMMKANKVAALVALGIGLGAAWWLSRPTVDTPPDPAPSGHEIVAAAPTGSEPDEERAVIEAPAPRPVAADTVAVRGRVTVTDENDQVWERGSGQLRLGVFAGENRDTREVAVTAGAFELEVPHDARLLVIGMEIEGRTAVADRRVLDVSGGDDALVEARFLGAIALRVVDAASGQELPTVEVCRRSRWRAIGDDLHPGDSPSVRPVARDVPSPVVLPPRDGPVVYWARAPGHAWGRALIRHDRPGERTIALGPPAAVTVSIENATAGALPDDLRVRLFRDDAPPAGAARAEPHWAHYHRGRRHAVDVAAERAGETVIEALPPGPYLARLQIGEEEGAMTLGEARCMLHPHQRTPVTLRIDSAGPRRVRLAGTLALPPGMDGPLRLALFRQRFGQEQGQKAIHIDTSAMTPDAAGPRLLHWDAGEVRPGRYWAYVSPVQHRATFEVPDDGLTDLAIELPERASVTVTLRDAETGAAVVPTRAGWSDAEELEVTDNMRADARRDRRRGTVSFVTVAGKVELAVEADNHEPASAIYELGPGDHHFTMELRPALGLRIKVHADGAVLPQDWRFWSKVRIERPEGAPAAHRSSDGSRSATRYFRQPGTYRVVFPPVEGYLPVPPREVVLRRGIVDVVIELVRG